MDARDAAEGANRKTPIPIWFRPREPWNGRKTRFPRLRSQGRCCSIKRNPGLMTRGLMRFAPGRSVARTTSMSTSSRPYVLEGSLVDKEGPGPGHRMQGRRIHLARGRQPPTWPWCPQGRADGSRIFQVPNKFFEADGRVIDAAGRGLGRRLGPTPARG